jgi:hypothetical protein
MRSLSMMASHGPGVSAATADGQSFELVARAVLEKISELADRQRAAIVARDVRTANRLYEALIRLHAELYSLMAEQPARIFPNALNPLATRVRQQLRLNQALLANGAAMTDHFMSLLVTSSEMGAPAPGAPAGAAAGGDSSAALFSGVA